MTSARVKNYIMFFLLYFCSLYHFVFSYIITILFEDLLFEHTEAQDIILRASLLPLYGFLTFTLMTCFMRFDFWWRECKNIKRFLDAFLFSQLAYIAYIYRFMQYWNGINAFQDGVELLLFDIPMLMICFPLSSYLFRTRLNKASQFAGNDDDDDAKIKSDFLKFWSIALICGVISYGIFVNQ